MNKRIGFLLLWLLLAAPVVWLAIRVAAKDTELPAGVAAGLLGAIALTAVILAPGGAIDAARGTTRRPPKNAGTVLVRIFVAVAAVTLAVLLVADEIEPGDAAVVVVLGALAVLALVPAALRAVAARIQKVEIPAVASVELTPAPPPGTDPGESPETAAKGLVDLRLLFQAKLAYIAKQLFARGGEKPFITVGSLHYDRLLSDEQAALADRLMTLTEAELAAFPDRDGFLEDARKLVGRVRAIVFYNWVRRTLEEDGWKVLDIPRGERRPDLLVEKRGRGRFRVRPAFDVPGNSRDLMTNAVDRLERSKRRAPEVRRRVIVVPNEVNRTAEDLAADPAIVELRNLDQALRPL